MGAWGHRSFDNDDASDWLVELIEAGDISPIEAALANVIENHEGYLEAPECTSALAAAEIVAALNGKPGEEIPDEALSWVRGKPRPAPALLEMARTAVSLVARSSELQELWAETEHAALWQAEVAQLQARLA
jgi:hypothetical protein